MSSAPVVSDITLDILMKRKIVKIRTVQDNSCIFHSLLTCIFPVYQENPEDRTKLMKAFRKSLLSYLRAPDTDFTPENIYEIYRKRLSETNSSVLMYDDANILKDLTKSKLIAGSQYRDVFNWSKSRNELYSGNSRMFVLNKEILIPGMVGRMREIAFRESPDEDIRNMRLDKIERNILNAENFCDNSVRLIIENALDINILIFVLRDNKKINPTYRISKEYFKENKPIILIFNTGKNEFEAGGIKKGQYIQTIFYPGNEEYSVLKDLYEKYTTYRYRDI